MAQFYSENGFRLGNRDKSYSSNFSKNPDSRNRNEISNEKRKKKQRELDHERSIAKVIQKRALHGHNKPINEANIAEFINCSCFGENENCYKCNGSGRIQKDINADVKFIPPLKVPKKSFRIKRLEEVTNSDLSKDSISNTNKDTISSETPPYVSKNDGLKIKKKKNKQAKINNEISITQKKVSVDKLKSLDWRIID